MSSPSDAEPFLPKVDADTVISVRFNEDKTPPRFAVAYWSIRGLGAPLRMMLSAAKVNHDVILHDLVENGEAGWTSGYFKTKADFIENYDQPLMNLPYVVDREQRRILCQSTACLAHIGRSIGMFGSNDIESSKCEELLCEIYDLRHPFIAFAYNSGGSADEAKEAFGKIAGILKKLEAYLKIEAKNNGGQKVCHLVGGKFSAPDFHLFELLDQNSAAAKKLEISDDLLGEYPHLKAFKEGFEKLDENQFYLSSWLHEGLPFNNCVAKVASALDVGLYKRGQAAEWRGKGEITMNGS